jgi:hypothetical protein
VKLNTYVSKVWQAKEKLIITSKERSMIRITITRWFPSLLGLVFLAGLGLAAGNPARDGGMAVSPVRGDITLVVTVLDGASKPVAGASVRVTPIGRNLLDGTTGRDGIVKFSVPSGTVRSIEVTASGYQVATMTNVQATSSPATSVRISLRPLVQMVIVPDVVGKTSQDAENIIKSKGIVCKLFMDVGDAAAAGRQNLPIVVQSQRPPAGTSVAPGTSISLTCVPRRK